MEGEESKSKFDQWCVVELMGHQRIAGKVTEESHFGVALMRVDVPEVEGRGAFTKYFGGNAIYAVTPTSEEIAVHVAKMVDQAPISRWEMRELLPAPEHVSANRVGEDYPDDDEDDYESDDPRDLF